MRHYFLGLAAGLGAKGVWRHTFAIGREKDREELAQYLAKKYQGQAILTKNGRTGLAIALRALLEPGDEVIVNGFTCYAVYEALEAAGVRPVWADISPRDLNFSIETVRAAHRRAPGAKGIIVQNTLGNPVDIEKIEKFAKKHGMVIIEDLAHSVGMRYADGKEVGTVGEGVAFSFGKDKVVDASSGGAVVLRGGAEKESSASLSLPSRRPRPSDVLRARFYPLLGAMTRGLSYVHLSGPFMRMLLKIHFVERSADNRLDFEAKIAKFEAKLALERLKRLPRRGRRPLRTFYLVRNRGQALKELQENGYYFSGFWYEKPVSPERYYDEVEFPEEDCPVATEVAAEIVNFPNYYNAKELLPARKIVETYEVKIRLTNRGVVEQIKEVALKNAKTGGKKAIGLIAGMLADKITDQMADTMVEAVEENDLPRGALMAGVKRIVKKAAKEVEEELQAEEKANNKGSGK